MKKDERSSMLQSIKEVNKILERIEQGELSAEEGKKQVYEKMGFFKEPLTNGQRRVKKIMDGAFGNMGSIQKAICKLSIMAQTMEKG